MIINHSSSIFSPHNKIIWFTTETSIPRPVLVDQDCPSLVLTSNTRRSVEDDSSPAENRLTEPLLHDSSRDDDSQSSDITESYSRAQFCMVHGAFFVGALLGTFEAVLDLRSARRYQNDPVDPDDDALDDDDDEWIYDYVIFHWDVLKTLSVASTFMYLVSVVTETCPHQNQKNCVRWLHIFFFGTAASLDLLSSLCENDDDGVSRDSYIFGIMSCDMFFCSALFQLAATRKDHRFACVHVHALLILVANLLFLAGSSIDAVVARLDGPEESNTRWLYLSRCDLASSLLWLLNSVLGALAVYLNKDGDELPSSSALDSL